MKTNYNKQEVFTKVTAATWQGTVVMVLMMIVVMMEITVMVVLE